MDKNSKRFVNDIIRGGENFYEKSQQPLVNFYYVSINNNYLYTVNGLASNTMTTDSQMFVVYRGSSGYLIPYPITIYNYFSADYQTSSAGTRIVYTVTRQDLGGVIYNAYRPGYYPFGQGISAAKSIFYRGYNYAGTQYFSWNNSPSMNDPNDRPYYYSYYSALYLYSDTSNELAPYITWYGSGTLPSTLALKTKSIYF